MEFLWNDKSKLHSPLRIEICDMMRCCRACLSVASPDELGEYIDLLQPLSVERGVLTLLESFNECTRLQIAAEDFEIEGYPSCQYICGRCRLDLRQAYEFITRARFNNELLKAQYTQLKTEVKWNDTPKSNGIVEVEREIKDTDNGDENSNFNWPKKIIFEGDTSENTEQLPVKLEEKYVDNAAYTGQNNIHTLLSVERLCNTERDTSQGSITLHEGLGNDEDTVSSPGVNELSEAEDIKQFDAMHKICFEFKCEFCTAIFDFQRDLLQHYEVDHGDKTLNFPCEYCENRFVTKNALRLHRRQIHQQGEYIDCDMCGRTVLKSFYSIHVKRHKQLKFLCSECPKTCASRYTLKKHMELHSKKRDRNIECIDCGRRFYNLDNLQLHQTIHTSPKDRAVYECTVCSKIFMRKSNLGLHMQLHRGETMDCPHCDKKFVRRKDLEIHIRFHTGDFPYSCSMCDRKFAIKGHLNYHEKRHLGVRYKCEECEKTFINLAGLRQHQYEHTGMPLLCAVCLRGFPTNFKVRRHLRTVHHQLFVNTGYTDALAKKYITQTTTPKLETKKDTTENTIEMLDEHAQDIPIVMLVA